MLLDQPCRALRVAFRSAMSGAPHCFSDSSIRTALGRLPVLARNHRDKVLQRAVPLTELSLGARTARVPRVQLDELAQQIAVRDIRYRSEIYHPGVAVPSEFVELVEHEGHSAAHS